MRGPAVELELDGPRTAIAERFARVRAASEKLAARLSPEDQTIQSMPDVSPTKWHLAHTSWFFETFLLSPHARGYRVFDPAFGYLFNSYYEAAGERHPRAAARAAVAALREEVLRYRRHVTLAMLDLIDDGRRRDLARTSRRCSSSACTTSSSIRS